MLISESERLLYFRPKWHPLVQTASISTYIPGRVYVPQTEASARTAGVYQIGGTLENARCAWCSGLPGISGRTDANTAATAVPG